MISGYLITRIILSELFATGSFGFLHFYERRARRILPMLFVVIFVSFPAAWLILLPSTFLEFVDSVLAATFFVANFFFYFSTTEYAADSALLKPMLHTWSLGVEEQFYLIFPLLALFAVRYLKGHFLTILVALALLSLQSAEMLESINAEFNFYSPFSRFWEMAVGAALALRELNGKDDNDSFWLRLFPIFGLYLIVYSILFFDNRTPHPSFHTIIPVLGVAMIIGFASKSELVGKILGSKPFVCIGLISYSAYLWHFPIIAFARNAFLSHSTLEKLGYIALTFLLSVISYFLVEQPFRDRTRIDSKLLWKLVGAASLVSLALWLAASSGLLKNEAEAEVDRLLDNGAFREEHRAFEIGYDFSVKHDDRKSILIVGNSHAEDLLKAMSFSYLDRKYRLNLVSPVRRNKDINYQVSCFLQYLSKGSTVCEGNEYAPNIERQYADADYILLAPAWRQQDIQLLPQLFEHMLADNKIVVVVSATPRSKSFGEKGLNRLDAFLFFNQRLPSQDELRRLEREFYQDYVHSSQSELNDRLKDAVDAASTNAVRFADRSDFICDAEDKRCALYFESDGAKLLWDDSHITTAGAKSVSRIIDQKQWLSDLESVR